MTAEERIRLERYREVSVLNKAHHVTLVGDAKTGGLYVRKELSVYNPAVIAWLRTHPVRHMPRIFETFEENGTLILIEEYIEGETLEAELERGTLSEKRAREISLALCDILSDLHTGQKPIVHRDVKPANIMLGPDGTVTLLDVNTAKFASPEENRDTALLGTEGFAAPEQYGFGSSDARADIYALGVTMNLMLTGQLPGEKPAEGLLGPIIQRATRLDVELRYPSAAAMKKAILTGNANGKRLRWLLPPGFRTGKAWKGALAAVTYFFIYLVVRSENEGYNTAMVHANRIGVILCLLGPIFFTCNWLDVHRHLPLTRSTNPVKRILGILLYDAILFVLPAAVCVALETYQIL